MMNRNAYTLAVGVALVALALNQGLGSSEGGDAVYVVSLLQLRQKVGIHQHPAPDLLHEKADGLDTPSVGAKASLGGDTVRTTCAAEVRARTPAQFQRGPAAWPVEFRICRDDQSTEPVLQLTETYGIAVLAGDSDKEGQWIVVTEGNSLEVHPDAQQLFEGVLQHPKLTSQADLDAADWIFTVNDNKYKPFDGLTPDQLKKVVRFDFGDGGPNPDPPYYSKTTGIVFARVLGIKKDGVLSKYSFEAYGSDEAHDIYPLTYPLFNRYRETVTLSDVGNRASRPITVGAYLRPWYSPENEVPMIRQVGASRNRVLWWLSESRGGLGDDVTLAIGPQTDGSFTGELTHETSKATILGIMRETYLQVVAEPAIYGESYRLYEALGSGSVLLHEPLPTPVDYAFEPNRHFFSFDVRDRPDGAADLAARIKWILDHPELAKAVAQEGWLHAQRFHSPANRVDYVVRTVATLAGRNSSVYTRTGPDLVQEYNRRKIGDDELQYGKWYEEQAKKNEVTSTPWFFAIGTGENAVPGTRKFPEPAIARALNLSADVSFDETSSSTSLPELLSLRARRTDLVLQLMSTGSAKIASSTDADFRSVTLSIDRAEGQVGYDADILTSE